MSIEEVYKLIDGDFSTACSNLLSSERVSKYAIRFLSNPDFDNLKKAMDEKDWKNAFLSVHTLKGLTLCLGFSNYGKLACLLTEELRDGIKSEEKATEYFKQLSEEHNKVINAISLYSE